MGLVNRGLFRQDLLYRIAVTRLDIPPLRERGDADICLIANHVLQQIWQQRRTGPKRFTRPALILLSEQPWPGNVRQLQNVVERGVVEAGSDADVIDEDHLLPGLTSATRRDPAATVPVVPLEPEVKNFIAGRIHRALAYTGQNRRAAAQLLGISEATLYRHLEPAR